MIVSSLFCSSHFLIFPCLIRQAMSAQESRYPHWAAYLALHPELAIQPDPPSEHSSDWSGYWDGCRIEFTLRFLNGTSIVVEADELDGVERIVTHAARHLDVQASFIRLFRGTTPLTDLCARVHDVVADDDELSVMVCSTQVVTEAN